MKPKVKPKIKPRQVQRASIGDTYYYKHWGAEGNTLHIIAESPTPGYHGYYAYFCEVFLKDGKMTHITIYGADIFKENSIYEKVPI